MRTGWYIPMLAIAPLLWTGSAAAQCVGNCGTLGPNGVVTAPPAGGPLYRYVSAYDGTHSGGFAHPSINNSNVQLGSVLTTSAFTAASGEVLSFYFNYVTSDGGGYADYAWAALLDATTQDPATAVILFTARTTPGGNTVPGFGMPAPAAIMVPASTAIIPGGPVWSPLGPDSGRCYTGPANGCGYTGWIQSLYTVVAGGNYVLQFGVTNWGDNSYDSGMAWAGAVIGTTPIDPTVVPEPVTMVLLGTGLALIGAVSRRRRRNNVV
jgi:hypothetical protein